MFMEYLKSGNYEAEKVVDNKVYMVYLANNNNQQHKRKVSNILTGEFDCDCAFCEEFGLPCRHVFYICKILGIKSSD